MVSVNESAPMYLGCSYRTPSRTGLPAHMISCRLYFKSINIFGVFFVYCRLKSSHAAKKLLHAVIFVVLKPPQKKKVAALHYIGLLFKMDRKALTKISIFFP